MNSPLKSKFVDFINSLVIKRKDAESAEYRKEKTSAKLCELSDFALKKNWLEKKDVDGRRVNMRFSEAKTGRVFVIRLEDGDILHEEIERFSAENGIRAATLTAVGGVDVGSRLIVGPEEGRAEKIVPMERVLDNVYEATGSGTIFPDEEGNPILHMHLACGRGDQTITGCVRRGVKVWHILEVVLTELTETSASRGYDSLVGFKLLNP